MGINKEEEGKKKMIILDKKGQAISDKLSRLFMANKINQVVGLMYGEGMIYPMDETENFWRIFQKSRLWEIIKDLRIPEENKAKLLAFIFESFGPGSMKGNPEKHLGNIATKLEELLKDREIDEEFVKRYIAVELFEMNLEIELEDETKIYTNEEIDLDGYDITFTKYKLGEIPNLAEILFRGDNFILDAINGKVKKQRLINIKQEEKHESKDYVILLDTSGSMEEFIDVALSAVRAILKKTNKKEVKVYTFDAKLRDELIVNSEEQLRKLAFAGGDTNIARSLAELQEKLEEDTHVILISDFIDSSVENENTYFDKIKLTCVKIKSDWSENIKFKAKKLKIYEVESGL
ncbi:MAG: vWA domain-containing protein [Candidatus Helarchaeota archaeon]